MKLRFVKAPGADARKLLEGMFPTQITLRNLRSSPDLTVRVRDLCEKLGHVHPRILMCRVAIELMAPPNRKSPSAVQPFTIELQVRLPQADIVSPKLADENLDVALRKAFAAMRRQLREAILVNRPAVLG